MYMPWYEGKEKIRAYLREVNDPRQVQISPLAVSHSHLAGTQAELTAPL
jgi:hypothetical protein